MTGTGPTGFDELPDSGAWVHLAARTGFEVAFLQQLPDGYVVEGTTSAFEEEAWTVTYAIFVGTDWTVRRGLVTLRSHLGLRMIEVRRDPAGAWWVDGQLRPDLYGCADIDLESSAVTNTFPVRRMALAVGDSAEAPAAYVRRMDLSVERLEQSYQRMPDAGAGMRFRYQSRAFDFSSELAFDASGLILDYPGIAKRHQPPSGP